MMRDSDEKRAAGPPPAHPKDEAWEPEDPLVLEGNAVPGEPEVMLQCLVEEYARMGWTTDQIVGLFASPFFQATFDLGRRLGKSGLRERIDAIARRSGVMRFRTVHAVPRLPDSAECDTCERSGLVEDFESNPTLKVVQPSGAPRGLDPLVGVWGQSSQRGTGQSPEEEARERSGPSAGSEKPEGGPDGQGL